MKSLVLLIVLFGVFAGSLCIAAEKQSTGFTLVDKPCVEKDSIKIYVYASGQLEVNGGKATISELSKQIESDSSIRKVCYSRESLDEKKPHNNAIKVMDIVVEAKLPIAFYWDKNFTKKVQF